jgi:hypothetical protein
MENVFLIILLHMWSMLETRKRLSDGGSSLKEKKTTPSRDGKQRYHTPEVAESPVAQLAS